MDPGQLFGAHGAAAAESPAGLAAGGEEDSETDKPGTENFTFTSGLTSLEGGAPARVVPTAHKGAVADGEPECRGARHAHVALDMQALERGVQICKRKEGAVGGGGDQCGAAHDHNVAGRALGAVQTHADVVRAGDADANGQPDDAGAKEGAREVGRITEVERQGGWRW